MLNKMKLSEAAFEIIQIC